jgi:hypothetical protein
MNNHCQAVVSKPVMVTQNALKPGFFISEGEFYSECKIKEMKIYVAIEMKYIKLILP